MSSGGKKLVQKTTADKPVAFKIHNKIFALFS